VAEFSAGADGWQHHLDAALDRGDEQDRIGSALQLAIALGFHQRLAEAVEVLDRVAATLVDPSPETSLTLAAVAVACGMLDATTAPLVADRVPTVRQAADAPSPPRVVLAVAGCLAALANEPADDAAALARRAVTAGPRPLPAPTEPPWFNHATITFVWAEHYAEARALLDDGIAEARRTANGLILPAVLSHRAWMALRSGDLTAAEADARALLDAQQPEATLLHRLLATAALVSALTQQDELDAAERALDAVGAAVQTTSQTAALVRHARGRLRLVQARYAEALSDFEAGGDIALRTLAPSPTYLPWRSGAALAHLGLGAPDVARSLAEEELELAQAFGAPRAIGVAQRTLGLVEGGERGEALLRAAITTLDGPDLRLERARVQADLGALLRRANRRSAARAPLREAIDAAHRSGARLIVHRAETELRATGARPRRVLLTGLEALIASERRIAELAAEGLTNREIAEHLFVTARTVEGHLTHVFGKLDITSRTELPAALGETARSAP
jgi:DNA-binding CsgD family transcriptional regulator